LNEPGPMLASGRDSDIFEYGPGLILRRSRNGRSLAIEARTMEHARAHGYPVPAISEISDDGTDLVMERIEGPILLDAIGRRPWTIRQQGALLADLHRRLHEIPAPDWLGDAPAGHGDRLVHLDLHPLNIILSAQGPVVIDWPNAAKGSGDVDVAATWVLLASGGIPASRMKAAVMGMGRSVLVKSFLAPFDLGPVRELLPGIVEWKVADPNMTDEERQVMWALVRDHR
jgi:aminoglycoside phosphotransferase (APT) family kinase protein